MTTRLTLDATPSHVDTYDFIELAIHIDPPTPGVNPFTDASVSATVFGDAAGPIVVDGFCDSPDGSLFKLRFMPRNPGYYYFFLLYRDPSHTLSYTHADHEDAGFHAHASNRPGLVQVDPEYPYHFRDANSGQPWFWNSTTAYMLAGLSLPNARRALDRLARHHISRVRMALSFRAPNGRLWGEPVEPSSEFSMSLSPWPATRPESAEDPGYDVTRFNTSFFRHLDAILLHARALSIQCSLIFFVDGFRPGCDPFGPSGAGSERERLYYRYVASRFAAFSNVMWDLINEWHIVRTKAWVEQTGAFLRDRDPYSHLLSVHGYETFPFRTAGWADYAMHQDWDEIGGYGAVTRNRLLQSQTGRPMPQVNEEFGYEDHYPAGHTKVLFPSRGADGRRRIAWGVAFAGGYCTTGERGNAGDGVTAHPDRAAGGWLNGLGGSDTTLLNAHAHLMAFMTSFPWYAAEPRWDLASDEAHCLATPDLTSVALYFPHPGTAMLRLPHKDYSIRWFNPRSGHWLEAPLFAPDPVRPTLTTPSLGEEDADYAVLVQALHRP